MDVATNPREMGSKDGHAFRVWGKLVVIIVVSVLYFFFVWILVCLGGDCFSFSCLLLVCSAMSVKGGDGVN